MIWISYFDGAAFFNHVIVGHQEIRRNGSLAFDAGAFRPEVRLQHAGIGPLVCQRISAGMAQHVRMNLDLPPLNPIDRALHRACAGSVSFS